MDTAGPMTRSIIDNIIVYNAINGYDSEDIYSKDSRDIDIEKVLNFDSSKVRLATKNFYENDSLYKKAVDHIKENNITAIEINS